MLAGGTEGWYREAFERRLKPAENLDFWASHAFLLGDANYLKYDGQLLAPLHAAGRCIMRRYFDGFDIFEDQGPCF